MIRLAVAVERETEEDFVKASLAPHLRRNNVYATPVFDWPGSTPCQRWWKR